MFSFPHRWTLFAGLLVLISAVTPVLADDAGQDDLDEAVRLKIAAESIEDLGKVIDKLDLAIEKGLEKGRAESKAEAVFAVLQARKIRISKAARERIQHCSDIAVLDRWIRRAATVEKAAELFDDPTS